MASELIYFHKGIDFSRRSCLKEPGVLDVAQNISFKIDGTQTLRPPFSVVNQTSLNVLKSQVGIHSIKTFRDLVIVADGGTLYANNGEGDFTALYTAFHNKIWQFREYKNFLSGVNGEDFILVDEYKNVYPARIDNPATAATGSAGTGSLTGHYMLYVSFLIAFPNGHTYETGLSPVSTDVDCAGGHSVEWANIPICTYTAYYGTAPTIYRKLYRGPGTGGTITAIYYVDMITDNTTTTYHDDITDTILQTSDISYVDIYGHPPVSRYIEWHYGRAFMIEEDHPHRLWWSEVASSLYGLENESLFPIATIDTSWDDLRTAGFQACVPQGLVGWGINLYIPLQQTWIRKQGNDAATWSYKKTYARHGIGAPYTIDYSSVPGGIIGVTNPEYGEPGLSLFDGQDTRIFSSPKLDYIFENDLNIDALVQCRGRVSGHHYHLLYPSGSNTEPDKYLAIDMRRYPDIRVAEWTDLKGQSVDGDFDGKNFYIGGSDGIVRKKDTSGNTDVLVETHDLVGDLKVGGSPVIRKTWRQLAYSIKGTVTLEFYIDDVLQKWPDGTTSKVITGTSEALQLIQSLPQNWAGYRMKIKITGTDLTELEIYSPWKIDYD